MAEDNSVHMCGGPRKPVVDNGCKHENTTGGFGLAGGGFGPYTYCEDCGQVIDKVCLDPDDEG